MWKDAQEDIRQYSEETEESFVQSLLAYQQNLSGIAAQLTAQRTLLLELEQLSQKQRQSDADNNGLSRTMQNIEAAKEKLRELESQFDATYERIQTKIQNQGNSRADFWEGLAPLGDLGMDVLADGLGSISETGGRAAETIGSLLEGAMSLRDGLSSVTSVAAKWGVGILSIFTMALDLTTMLAENAKQAEEERQKIFAEDLEKSRAYVQQMNDLNQNMQTLQNPTASLDEIQAARQQIAAQFPDMIAGYDNEGKAILLGNEYLKERISYLQQEQEFRRQGLAKDITTNLGKYQDAKTEQEEMQELVEKYQSMLENGQLYMPGVSSYGAASNASVEVALREAQEQLETLTLESQQQKEVLEESFRASLLGCVELEDAAGNLTGTYLDMSEAQRVAFNTAYIEEYFDAFSSGERTKEEIAEEMNTMLNSPEQMKKYTQELDATNAELQRQADIAFILTEQYGQQSVTVDELTSAYQKLSEGASLSKEEMQKLAQGLPEVYDYIQQTEDLTLQNGQVLADAQYQAYADSLNELSTAYQTLSSGQSLSLEQLDSLQAKHGQIQTYLRETGDLTLRNGEIIRKVAEAEREATIAFLEGNRERLVSQKETTETYITMLEGQLASYGAIANAEYSSVTTQQRMEQLATGPVANQKRQELEEQCKDLEQQIEQIEETDARLAAIRQNLWGTDSSGSSTHTNLSSVQRGSGLSEELKKLDHQKKMEQLSLEEELAWLNKLQQKYNELAEDRMNLEYRVFSVEKEIREKERQSVQEKLDATYDEIDQKERMSEDSLQLAQEEYRKLNDLRKQYVYAPDEDWTNATKERRAYLLTKEQDLDLNARLYESQKKLAEAQKKAAQGMLDSTYNSISHKKAMDQLPLAEELKLLEEVQHKAEQMSAKFQNLTNDALAALTEEQAQYILNAEQKMELDEKVYAVRKQLQDETYNQEYQAIQNKVRMGDMSIEEEIEHLERLQRKYKKNKDIQMELEIELFNLKAELRQKEAEAVDSLANVLVEALRNRYEEQRKAEQDRINESIESWQKWENETVSAIQGQIDALDELEKQEESEEKRREYERKKQAIQLQLAYEKDDYQRKQYQQELARLEQEEQERLDEEAREAERKRLEQEIKKAQEESQKQQDALREQLDKINEEYDEMTSEFHLRAEAEKAIMASTQKEIIDLIKSYAPEYDLAGQSIGEKLADGFKKKFGDVLDYVQEITDAISDYQQALIDQANAAADTFWQAHQNPAVLPQPPASLSAAKDKQVQVTVNFNQPVESPVETRRAIESVMNEIARQIG